jgi:transposase InsO family protein
VSHRNAPLTPAGRLRLIERCRSRPIAHVAAEAAVSRQCLSKWKRRYDAVGEVGLLDRSSAPWTSPTQLDAAVVDRIAVLRRTRKWSARRIALALVAEGTVAAVSASTVGRWLVRLGLNQRRHLDPDGENNRRPGRITARYPGHMIHIDVKKCGRIPAGGGWRAHGRDSAQHRAAERAKARKNGAAKAGYVYLHTAIDGFSRLVYTEHLPDEQGATAAGFWHRARAFFAAHGIARITRVVTDNGACYRSTVFARALAGTVSRHQRIKPFTPKHNAKVERYHRILAEELLYTRTWNSEAERAAAIGVWNIHYNYHRPHTAASDQPPATRLPARVTNLMTSNS